MTCRRGKQLLIALMLVSALLRLWGLQKGDPVNDEGINAFRAVGMMDFDEAPQQTTPLEWFDPARPFWTRMSFHDHPPLVFLTQHVFMRVLGEQVWVFRLPSAFLGVVSVWLLYLLGKRLYGAGAGLMAAILFGITLNSVYISRVGLQESFVIFFILLTLYFFIRALEHSRWFLLVGVALGLGLLAKYTAAIIVPALLLYALLFRRDIFQSRQFWFGMGVAFALFLPVIVYNIQMYRAVGHFDFQFSFIFGQASEEWPSSPGKEIGTMGERLRVFVPRLIATHSWVFLFLFAASVAGFFAALARNARAILRRYALLLCAGGFVVSLLLVIGPSFRFLTMLTPFFALAVGVFSAGALSEGRGKKLGVVLFGGVLLFEFFYTINNQWLATPIGPEPWLSSRVRQERADLGFNKLGAYFAREFAERVPALTFNMRYQFLEQLRQRALDRGIAQHAEPYPALVVFDGEFNRAERIARIWTLDRLLIYHAWPVIDSGSYAAAIAQHGADYYRQIGFRQFYIVIKTGEQLSPALQPFLANTARIEHISAANGPGFTVYRALPDGV